MNVELGLTAHVWALMRVYVLLWVLCATSMLLQVSGRSHLLMWADEPRHLSCRRLAARCLELEGFGMKGGGFGLISLALFQREALRADPVD